MTSRRVPALQRSACDRWQRFYLARSSAGWSTYVSSRPVGQFGGRPPQPAIDLGLPHPGPQRLRMNPQLVGDPLIAPVLVAGSRRASSAIRVARPLNSSLYFFGATTALILPGMRASTRPGAIQATSQDGAWPMWVHPVDFEPRDPTPAGGTQSGASFWLPNRPVRRNVVGNWLSKGVPMLSRYTPVATLPASDLTKARSFYEDTLGLTVQRDGMGGVSYTCGSGNLFVYESAYTGTNKATSVTSTCRHQNLMPRSTHSAPRTSSS